MDGWLPGLCGEQFSPRFKSFIVSTVPHKWQYYDKDQVHQQQLD